MSRPKCLSKEKATGIYHSDGKEFRSTLALIQYWYNKGYEDALEDPLK